MDKKFKFASAIISAGLLITPISGLVNSYDNVAKAEQINIKESNIKKHINYIDSNILVKNNQLIINNKDNVINYIKKNWNEININNKFDTPEDYYNDIESSIIQMNKKLNSGWYKLNIDKSISQRFQSRYMHNGYEKYDQWYGIQIYIHDKQGLENFINEMIIAKNNFNTSLGAFIPFLGTYRINVFTKIIENSRATFDLYGSVKVTLYKTGSADVERIQ